MRITGSYEKLGELDYFVPNKLPPDSPFVMDSEIAQKFKQIRSKHYTRHQK
jgi:hypothetical protein